jgi:hypothetical protein
MPKRLHRPLQSALALVCAGALAAPAAAQSTTEKPPDPVTGAVQQPFKDLNIVHDKIPPVLSRAATAPYVETQPRDCAAMESELAELDDILGPDLDAAKSGGGDILSGALRNLTELPFRGVVRKLSGAEKREKVRTRAIIAGVARRGFLKGVLRSTCNAPPPVAVLGADGLPPAPR